MINETDVLTITLPAMAVRGIIPLPNNEMKLDVGRDDSILAIKEAINTADKEMVLFVQKKFNQDKVNPEDLNKMGLIVRILSNTKQANIVKLEVKGIIRCEVVEFVSVVPFMKATVITKPFESTDINSEIACVRMLVKELEGIGPRLFKNNPALIKQVSSGVTIASEGSLTSPPFTID